MELNWAPRHNWQDAGPAPAPPAPLWPVPGQPPPPPPAPPAGAGTTTHGEPVGTSEALTLTPEGDDGNGPDGLVPGREEVLPPPRSLTLLREVSFRTRI
ncbi:MAG: hypothetical protein ACLP7F_18700, partial [Acidimicrobiales bacterium]